MVEKDIWAVGEEELNFLKEYKNDIYFFKFTEKCFITYFVGDREFLFEYNKHCKSNLVVDYYRVIPKFCIMLNMDFRNESKKSY